MIKNWKSFNESVTEKQVIEILRGDAINDADFTQLMQPIYDDYDVELLYDVELFHTFNKGIYPKYTRNGFINSIGEVLPEFLSSRSPFYLNKISDTDKFDTYYFRSIKLEGRMFDQNARENLKLRAKKALNLDMIHYRLGDENNINFFLKVPETRIIELASIWMSH
jgi:hypothetical protein